MVCKYTLRIKHLPKELTDAQKEDFVRHFGATKVKVITSKAKAKSVVYAQFETEDAAKNVMLRLHQIYILNCRLSVEYADTDVLQGQLSNQKVAVQDGHDKRFFQNFINNINAFNESVGFHQPPPSHLKYHYPTANRATINNIAHALATVPRFYTQVLHLMNKMNLPPPFAMPDVPVRNVQQQLPTVVDVVTAEKRKQSSSESEIESDGESKGKEIIPVKRTMPQKRPIKRPKFIRQPVVQNTGGTGSVTAKPVEKAENVFEKVAVQPQRKIELKVSQEPLTTVEAPKLTELEGRKLTEPEARKLTELKAPKLTELDARKLTEPEPRKLTELEPRKLTELEARKITEYKAPKLTKLEARKLTELEPRKLTELEPRKLTEPGARKLTELKAPKLTKLETRKLIELEPRKLTELEPRKLTELEAPKLTTEPPVKPVETEQPTPTISLPEPEQSVEQLSSENNDVEMASEEPLQTPMTITEEADIATTPSPREPASQIIIDPNEAKQIELKLPIQTELKPPIQTQLEPIVIEDRGELVPTDTIEEPPARAISPEDEFPCISLEELAANQITDLTVMPVFKKYNAGEPTNKLYIKNCAKTVVVQDLEYIYNRYREEVKDRPSEFNIRLMQEGRMKGQAFVTLDSVEQAQKAVKETNGFILKDRPLVVVFGKAGKKQ